MVSPESLRMAYFGFLKSHVSYGLILWGHPSIGDRYFFDPEERHNNSCKAGPLDYCRP